MKRGGARDGFTLVELLLAIFIFSLVLSIVYGSYRATFHVVNGVEEQSAVARQVNITFERVREDLGSVVLGDEGLLVGEKIDDSDRAGFSLKFISTQHVRLRGDDEQRGWAQVRYYTKLDDNTGLLNLYRDESLIQPEDDAEAEADEEEGDADNGYLILAGLRGTKVSYFGAENESLEQWDSTDKVDGEEGTEEEEAYPRLILIDLEVASKEGEETNWLYRTAVSLRENWSEK